MKFTLLASLLSCATVFAQKYETVVEGTSFNSASKVILDQEAIKKSRAPNITSLLSSQANISVSNNNFQPSSIFLRGGDASHILILVDGLPFYDASTTQKTMNLNSLDIKTIRRIEIIKGSQSVLYGGQALSGVIKIETIPTEIENKAIGAVELGQYEYQKASLVGLKALDEKSGVLGRAGWAYENSRSPVLDSDFRYPHHLTTGDVAYIYQNEYQTFFKLSQTHQRDDITTTIAPPAPADYKAVDTRDFEAENTITGVIAGLKAKKWKMHPTLLASYQDASRSFLQRAESTDEKFGSQLYNLRGEVTPVDLQEMQVVAGASYLKENFLNRSSGREVANAFSEQKGVFGKLDYRPNSQFEMEAGLRTDFVSHRSRSDTYQLGFTFSEDFKLEYATGYRAPSLWNMYNSTYGGSADLKDEKAQTYSATWEHSFDKQDQTDFVSATIFETSFENLIVFQGAPPTGSYINLAKAQTRGVEASYTHKVPEIYRFDLSLGYQEPWDVVNARWLIRRPLQTGSVRLTVGPASDQIGLEEVWNGDKVDRFSSKEYSTLTGYAITNAFYNHQYSEQISGYLRGSNIGNVRYESSRGYFDEGAFWLAGIEISN